MGDLSAFVVLVIAIAFLFDFINGFHDAGNSIATLVTTQVMTPRQAVLWAAFFNFSALLVFRLGVAKTIGYGLIDVHVVTTELIFSALIGAVSWNLWTWYAGLPSSASHALIGGLAGAALFEGGWGVLIPSGFMKVLLGIIVAPMMGIVMGWLAMSLFSWLFSASSQQPYNPTFKSLQMVSSAFLSLTHGGNDAQKTMGVIALLLFSTSPSSDGFYIPVWVMVSCYGIISLGTLVGGWRVVKTMGERITLLNPKRGSAAETGSAILLFIATEMGIPMSTTQTVTGAIAGVGLHKSWKEINWGVLLKIFLSWMLTIPAAGLVAATVMWFM